MNNSQAGLIITACVFTALLLLCFVSRCMRRRRVKYTPIENDINDSNRNESNAIEVVTQISNNNDMSDNGSGMKASVLYLSNNIDNNAKNCNETESIAINSVTHGINGKNMDKGDDWLFLASCGYLREGYNDMIRVEDFAMIVYKLLNRFVYINNKKYSIVKHRYDNLLCKFYASREDAYHTTSMFFSPWTSQLLNNNTNNGPIIKMSVEPTKQPSKLDSYGDQGYHMELGMIRIPKKEINYNDNCDIKYNMSHGSNNSLKYSSNDLKMIYETGNADYSLRYGAFGICPSQKEELEPFDRYKPLYISFQYKSWPMGPSRYEEPFSWPDWEWQNKLQQERSQAPMMSFKPVTFGIGDKIDMYVERVRDAGHDDDTYYLYFVKDQEILGNSEKHSKIKLNFEKYDYLPALSSRCVHGCDTEFSVRLGD